MGFLMIVFSGILDVLANLCLQKSNGFKNLIWGISALVLVDAAFLLLAYAVSFGIALPIAYTLWGAIGILGSVLGGYVFFKQKLKPIGYVGVVLVISAVLLLNL
ncbi:SMR family transporter [Helicobacter himalayensis]|uniref:SMR family transporter n=1 Tax=Helicobacter himalayensis TaxID=1591088 RepID=UPI003D6FB062